MECGGKWYVTYPSKADVFTVWNFADLHMGSKACAEDRLREDVARVKDDPYALWVGGGDYADFIGYTDRRFDPDSVADWVSVADLAKLGQASIERVRDLFKPIAGKGLGLLLGNHEKKYALAKDHEGLHGWLCTELELPDLGYSCLFDLVFARNPSARRPRLTRACPPYGERNSKESASYRFFVHHGAGYAQTPGGKLNRLSKFMDDFQADIYMCGHVHDQVGRRKPQIGADRDCKRLRATERLGVISGSYLKTYAQGVCTYGEQRGYSPVSLGAAWVAIKPSTGELRAEV